MARGALLWLLGVPIPIIILLFLFWHSRLPACAAKAQARTANVYGKAISSKAAESRKS